MVWVHTEIIVAGRLLWVHTTHVREVSRNNCITTTVLTSRKNIIPAILKLKQHALCRNTLSVHFDIAKTASSESRRPCANAESNLNGYIMSALHMLSSFFFTQTGRVQIRKIEPVSISLIAGASPTQAVFISRKSHRFCNSGLPELS